MNTKDIGEQINFQTVMKSAKLGSADSMFLRQFLLPTLKRVLKRTVKQWELSLISLYIPIGRIHALTIM